MPKKAAALGPLAVSRLVRPGMHFVGGVAGLALQVLPTGGRSWVLRVRVGSKRRDMGLGGYPDVTLASAREKAAKARDKIREGVDPVEEGRKARALLKLAQANAIPFRQASIAYIETHEPSWHNAKHAQQWRNSLETYAYPHIGQIPVGEIGLPHVLNVLEPIWRAKTETASRVRGRIESVLDWATTKGYREGLNPARWRGHLDNLLPSPGKTTRERHFPALPARLIGAFVAELRDVGGIGARALEFAILTAARSVEVRGARWSEIDLDEALWIVPAARMKMKVEHRVPLSRAAVRLLKALRSTPQGESLPEPKPGDLVFPAPRGGVLSDGTLNAVIDRMNERSQQRWVDGKDGRPVVQHGFRSTFRDWAAEYTNHPREVAEMALAHTIGDKVEAAYRRGDLYEKRAKLMQSWADYCGRVQTDATVTPIRARKA